MFLYSCLNPIAEVGLNKFNDYYKKCDNTEEADAILVRSASMHEMDFSDNLKAIARAGAGVNNIPLDRCTEKGIVVFNTPGANANGVKELVIAGMLLASRGIVDGIQWVKDNAGDPDIAKSMEKAKKQFAGCELRGKKLGVIGLGAIGIRVANAASALGMDVYGYDPYMSVDAAWQISRKIVHFNNVNDIYSTCDYITIHVPLLDETRGMINKDAIALMHEGAVVLNFARDVLVNEKDMVEALKEKKIRAYVSDFANPITAGAPGCIITPHLGASTAESEDNCAVMAVKELKDYLENGNINNSVNFPKVDLGPCSKTGGRIAIFHKNVANMLVQFTNIFGSVNENISNLSSKCRGEFAYTLIDIDKPATEQALEALKSIAGVIKVRTIQ